MKKVLRGFEWYFTHKIHLRCFKQRNTILLKIPDLIMINILTYVPATTISYVNDRIHCKSNAANNEIHNATTLYNRLQVFTTDILLARRNCSVSMTETRVLKITSSLWMWHCRYLLTKVFPRAVGNYNDRIRWDISGCNLSKPYLTYNASACCLKLNTKLSFKRILNFIFWWWCLNV
jgi:hypothetical protein